MSVPRLTFLYPHLFKPRRFREPIAVSRPFNESDYQSRRAGISTTAPRKQEAYPQRYGPAAEAQLPPPSQPPVANHLGRDKSLAGAIEKELKPPLPKQEDRKATEAPPKDETPAKDQKEPSPTAKPPLSEQHARNLDASESHPKETLSAPPGAAAAPLDTGRPRPPPGPGPPGAAQRPPRGRAPRPPRGAPPPPPAGRTGFLWGGIRWRRGFFRKWVDLLMERGLCGLWLGSRL